MSSSTIVKLLLIQPHHIKAAKMDSVWMSSVRLMLSKFDLIKDFFSGEKSHYEKLKLMSSDELIDEMLKYPLTYFSQIENPELHNEDPKLKAFLELEISNSYKLVEQAIAEGIDSPKWFAFIGECYNVAAYVLYPLVRVPGIVGLGNPSDWKIYYSVGHACLVNNVLANMITSTGWRFSRGEAICTTEYVPDEPMFIDLNIQSSDRRTDILTHLANTDGAGIFDSTEKFMFAIGE